MHFNRLLCSFGVLAMVASFGFAQEKKEKHSHGHDSHAGHDHGHAGHDHGHAGHDHGAGEHGGEMDAEMAAWMASMTPSAHHVVLEGMVGKWDVTSTMWMAPGAPPMVTTATSNNTWAFGKRFVKMEYTSTFMGQPFEGLGYTGYDNNEKAYVSTWMDNMSTGIMRDTGTWDSASNKMHMTGQFCDPSGGVLLSRNVIHVKSPDEFTFSMYHTKKGEKEMKSMELVYKRSS